MKKLITVIAALCLAGCSAPAADSGTEKSSEQNNQTQTDQAVVAEAKKDFDGSAYEETPEGDMIIYTAGGSSEDGNIPTIVANPDTLLQIELDTSGFNGEVLTVYVDGIKNTKLNAGTELNQNVIDLTGDDLTEGTHTVEIVHQEDGANPTIYKKVEYKVESDQ